MDWPSYVEHCNFRIVVLQLKCLVTTHEKCVSSLNLHLIEDVCVTAPSPHRSKGTLLCFPPVPLLLFHFEGEGTATCRLTFVEDDLFI